MRRIRGQQPQDIRGGCRSVVSVMARLSHTLQWSGNPENHTIYIVGAYGSLR